MLKQAASRKLLLLAGLVVLKSNAQDECLPVTQLTIDRVVAYANLHYKVPGGVIAVRDNVRRFPLETCFVRIPIRAKDPTIPFHLSLTLSPDRRYVGTDMADLGQDPEEAERLLRLGMIRALNDASSPTLGPAGGPVSVVVFSDFQCPYSKALDVMLRAEILSKTGDVVSVRFRNLPLPFHPHAREAALIGACVAQQGDSFFWEFAGTVFENQKEIFQAHDPVTELESVATRIAGLSKTDFWDCRASKSSERALSADEEFALDNGVRATPTVFVDDLRIQGLPRSQDLFRLIDEAARQQKADTRFLNGTAAEQKARELRETEPRD